MTVAGSTGKIRNITGARPGGPSADLVFNLTFMLFQRRIAEFLRKSDIAMKKSRISFLALKNLLHKRCLLLLMALASFLLVFFKARRLLGSSRSIRLSRITMGMLSRVGMDFFSGGPDFVL